MNMFKSHFMLFGLVSSLFFLNTSLTATESLEDFRLEAGTQESEADIAILKAQRVLEGDRIIESLSEERVKNGLIYFTSHPGAFHNPMFVFNGGSLVELEDGSQWNVAYADRYKTLNWLTSDVVVITPDYTPWSSYDYTMVNQNTGATISINLSIGPYHTGPYTYWIIGFDDYAGVVYLEDGSAWTVSPYDDPVTRPWLLEDRVIVGVNTGWDANVRPNILINVRKDNYIRVNCIQ